MAVSILFTNPVSRLLFPKNCSEESVTVTNLIDEAPIGWFQIRTYIFCILVSLFDGFDTQSIAFVAPAISSEWQLSKITFGFVFSSTLLGTVIGAAIFGVLADKFGRKRLVVLNTMIFGAFSGACALASSVDQLILFRLLGGIGMGGVIPNMMALTSEYAPRRRRATITTFTLWGFPAGAVLGGLIAGPLIEAAGWRAIFFVGAVAPITLALILIPLLPESIHFMERRPASRDAMLRLLARIDPCRAQSISIAGVRDYARPMLSKLTEGSIAGLFAPGLGLQTAMVSAAMFSSLFLTYLLINWIPVLLESAGLSLTQAIIGTVAINLGGIVGSYLLSRIIDAARRPVFYLVVGYSIAAFVIVMAGRMIETPALVLMSLVVCGFFLIGSQMSMTAYSAGQYPPIVRGTAIGFIQAVGRVGSLIGPIAGGALLTAGISVRTLFALGFFPAALAGIFLLILAIAGPQGPRAVTDHHNGT